MKPIIIIALILLYAHFNDAHAAPFLVMDFNKDVKIFLSTNQPCPHGGLKAYAARLDGSHVQGCYSPKKIDGKLWIRIDWVLPDGQVDFSEFAVASFTKIDDKQNNYKGEF